MALQLAFVLVAIIIGARLGGIGLGVMGGIGLAILTFGFGLQPTSPPIDVMLMIAAVISAASCMQAAGGLDYMVKLAERLLRKNPSQVTILSPIVTYLFTSSNPQPIGFSGILLAKRQNSFYCTYFLHNRNVADTKSPYPIKRLEVIRWFNQKSMVFNQSLS